MNRGIGQVGVGGEGGVLSKQSLSRREPLIPQPPVRFPRPRDSAGRLVSSVCRVLVNDLLKVSVSPGAGPCGSCDGSQAVLPSCQWPKQIP